MARNTVLAFTCGMTSLLTLEIGKKMKSQATAFIAGTMVEPFMVNGLKTTCMDMESMSGLTNENTKANM